MKIQKVVGRVFNNLEVSVKPIHLVSLILFTVALSFVGCTKYSVRDQTVYQTELNQYDNWATAQAKLLKEFVGEICVCDTEGKFTDKRCRDSADYILTVETRHQWHLDMSLYLGGVTEDRPSEELPEIPASSTLCPAPELTPESTGGE